MSYFNEANTVETFIRDLLCNLGWHYLSHEDLPRQAGAGTQDFAF